MSGIDGAVLDEFTQGINTPGDGQQGYFTFADQATPYPNLEYKSHAETAQILRLPLAKAASAKSAPGASVVHAGTAQLGYTFGNGVVYGVREFLCRVIARVGSTLQYAGRLRVVITTNAAGGLVSSAEATEYAIGSGFSMAIATGPGATGFTFVASNGSGSTASYFQSITEMYNEQIV